MDELQKTKELSPSEQIYYVLQEDKNLLDKFNQAQFRKLTEDDVTEDDKKLIPSLEQRGILVKDFNGWKILSEIPIEHIQVSNQQEYIHPVQSLDKVKDTSLEDFKKKPEFNILGQTEHLKINPYFPLDTFDAYHNKTIRKLSVKMDEKGYVKWDAPIIVSGYGESHAIGISRGYFQQLSEGKELSDEEIRALQAEANKLGTKEFESYVRLIYSKRFNTVGIRTPDVEIMKPDNDERAEIQERIQERVFSIIASQNPALRGLFNVNNDILDSVESLDTYLENLGSNIDEVTFHLDKLLKSKIDISASKHDFTGVDDIVDRLKSDLFMNLYRDIYSYNRQYACTILDVDNQYGIWREKLEPSYGVNIEIKNKDNMKRFASRLGSRYDQDAVLCRNYNRYGQGRTWSVKLPDKYKVKKIYERLVTNGFQGATINLGQKNLELVFSKEQINQYENIQQLQNILDGLSLGKTKLRPADVVFIEKKDYATILNSGRKTAQQQRTQVWRITLLDFNQFFGGKK